LSGEIDLTDRGVFSYWHTEKLRFSDTDMIGHVNNVAFAALIESGRVSFTHSGVVSGMPGHALVVMRHISIDYRAELHWPADIDIGCRLMRIGRSSFSIGNGVFHQQLCAATAVTTLVVIDRQTRRAIEIPAEVRGGLERYL
jgi:acyl-CoA thioester hydrolase